jgi:hypothetical protein
MVNRIAAKAKMTVEAPAAILTGPQVRIHTPPFANYAMLRRLDPR